MKREFELIDRIAAILGRTGPGLQVGIGDDAAVLAPIGERVLFTIDASVEGVHFERAWLSFADIGYRATVAAVSDVLAMGGRPISAIAAWTLPEGISNEEVEAIARGQREAADALGIAIAGGNISRGPVLSITTSAIGAAKNPIGRGGAKAGDRLVACGIVGASALGLRALRDGSADFAPEAVAAFRRPQILRQQAHGLAQVARAMIDVSDGLAQDVGHLARASGLRAVIDLESLQKRRVPAIGESAALMGVELEELELAGGEDYALVAAVPKERVLPLGADSIGFLEVGEGVVVLRDGERELPPEGFRHDV
ncbi:MAG: thiamine-phosphate kinase [Polyangiales bacterium]